MLFTRKWPFLLHPHSEACASALQPYHTRECILQAMRMCVRLLLSPHVLHPFPMMVSWAVMWVAPAATAAFQCPRRC